MTLVGPLYGLDIETDTRTDGLDPASSRVLAAALSPAADGSDLVLTGEEPELLARLDAEIAELPAGVIVTWNGARFDLPFLAHRARLVGVDLGLRLRPRGVPAEDPWPPPVDGWDASWGPHGHLDGYRLYRGDLRRVLGVSCALKAVARLVGLPALEVDRERIHQLDVAALSAYVAGDARLARQLVALRCPAALSWVDPSGRDPRTGSRAPVSPLDLDRTR